jgi:polyisoprenoid-binding protein YceI
LRIVPLAAAALIAGLFASPARSEPSLDPATAPAGHYVLDPRHASVIARVRHMGLSNYTMRFRRVEASYDYDPANPSASKVSVTIDAHSIDTGDEGISRQFASEFLDAGAHPNITFESTAIQPTETNHGTVVGDLDFRGVTKPVTLAVTYDGTEANLIGGRRMGFSATATIKRSDFGSKAWRNVVGDEVGLVIEAEFVRK